MKTAVCIAVLATAFGLAANARAEKLTREQINAEVQKCTEKLNSSTGNAGEDYKQCINALMARTTSKPPEERPASRPQPVDGRKFVDLYHCRIPALAHSRLGSEITIWSSIDKKRYAATPSSNENQIHALKGFGTPGKGNVSFTFSDGARITIAQNGWTTTSLDKVHNKNSLYGPVSPAKNDPAGQCSRVTGPNAVVRVMRIE